MNRIAICAGSFDPPTEGHLNIINRGLKLFDKIIIAVAINMSKTPTLSVDERLSLLKKIFEGNSRVEVDSFEGLLVHYAQSKKTSFVLRGIRNMSDYEYESQMALANKTLWPELETLFMMTEGKYAHISSSIIKEIITVGGSAEQMVHPLVENTLKEKLRK
ncbi:MAG: pantetheine-phosphate adenylyltransferase [Deltaproteobacteria bacterium CG11_big_fil_rev_8_21_14_0_20_42_23]|nr:MAG: pantetheine-phosphate adenylyltransferase [Deltaproteobacteria bacterium CG11_big_fil_rev_8_21_14_0_20_42_23]PJC63604.1 MAG: pantetheine-phosphate adenylyltransferase [Deltaproteobacteria bacterium CG_4_9_14_0_2_um_filter_42_21]